VIDSIRCISYRHSLVACTTWCVQRQT